MKKIINLVGARPQFIKYYPVSKALAPYVAGNSLQDILIHTGQHYDYNMSKIFFDELGIKEPDYHLNIGSGKHGAQTASILMKVEDVLVRENPDMMVVYGDTNSTLSGALAASKLHIPVAHVEAGLRSFNKAMPEEINRVMTDHMSTILFCPSEVAVRNLEREGFQVPPHDDSRVSSPDYPLVVNAGDVMYDILLSAVDIAEVKSLILTRLSLQKKDYNLLTIHRAESTDNPQKLKEIIQFVNHVAADKAVVFPMHPRLAKIYDHVDIKFSENVKIIEPLGYFDLVLLLKYAAMLFTDSGGMQKEAFWLKTPCVTLRDETEWVETVMSGWNVLYKNYEGFHGMSHEPPAIYGHGTSGMSIAKTILAVINQAR